MGIKQDKLKKASLKMVIMLEKVEIQKIYEKNEIFRINNIQNF